MDKPNRLATNNKVEVIDKESEYFGKIGRVIDANVRPVTMINSNGKTTGTGKEVNILVRFEEKEVEMKFAPNQLKKIT